MTEILTELSQSVAANDANMRSFMSSGAAVWPRLEIEDTEGIFCFGC